MTQETGNRSHTHNFVDCVRSRRAPNADVAIGCRSATVCHLGNIAHRLRRSLKWDPVNENFIDDEEANRLLDRGRREPWTIQHQGATR